MRALDTPGLRAVLFDLDGVLIESYDVWFHLLNAAAHAFGHPPISAGAFRQAWGQGVQADRDRFFPDRTIAEIERFYHAHFLEHAEHLRIAPRVSELFEALAARQLLSAVITNTPMPLAAELVARAGGRPHTVVGGTDVARAKPAPDMVLEACVRLGVAPREALVVGDTSLDRDAASAAACRFVGIGIEGDWSLGAVAELLSPSGAPGAG